MKKLQKLKLKKVTLKDLDERKLDGVAAGATVTCDKSILCTPSICNYC
jgi:natural product precursor